jgi:hypothetical protein
MLSTLTLSTPGATIAQPYGFASRKAITENNLLKRHGNLFKILLY